MSAYSELARAEDRIRQLDTIISRLYEDNISGKVSDERFAKMLASYEAEQKTLDWRVSELRTFIGEAKEQRLNAESFLSMVRKYSEITELTPEIVRAFVEKIEVQQPEKVPGSRTKKQTIVIFWNFIGPSISRTKSLKSKRKRHSLPESKLCRNLFGIYCPLVRNLNVSLFSISYVLFSLLQRFIPVLRGSEPQHLWQRWRR